MRHLSFPLLVSIALCGCASAGHAGRAPVDVPVLAAPPTALAVKWMVRTVLVGLLAAARAGLWILDLRLATCD